MPKDTRVEAIKALVHKLPVAHYKTLEFIMRHLTHVAEQAKTNKVRLVTSIRCIYQLLQMEYKNISIVFGPTLVTCASHDPLKLV